MYKLYNVKTWGSLAIHLLLEELGVPYTNIWMTAEQVKDPEYRAINPLGMVPALGLADGRSLYESAAIVSFLVAAHPDGGMAPVIGSDAYGEFMSVLHLMSTELYQTNNLAAPGSGYALTPEQDAHIVAAARERTDGYWRILEERLKAQGPWLMGEEFSALDLYCFMLTLWGRPTEKALQQRFPAIARLATGVRARPKLMAALDSHGVVELGGYGG
jgi:glutathione S-transferase